MTFFTDYFDQICGRLNNVDAESLNKITDLIMNADKNGKKVMIVGNGGSAAIASHVSVDLTKNSRIRAINFNEADLITCLANDYGYERWVEKAIEFYADIGDVAILISSSGKSENIINAALKAKELGIRVVTLSGFDIGNPLRQIGDINLWVESNVYNVIETIHSIWLLSIVDKIREHQLFTEEV